MGNKAVAATQAHHTQFVTHPLTQAVTRPMVPTQFICRQFLRRILKKKIRTTIAEFRCLACSLLQFCFAFLSPWLRVNIMWCHTKYGNKYIWSVIGHVECVKRFYRNRKRRQYQRKIGVFCVIFTFLSSFFAQDVENLRSAKNAPKCSA